MKEKYCQKHLSEHITALSSMDMELGLGREVFDSKISTDLNEFADALNWDPLQLTP